MSQTDLSLDFSGTDLASLRTRVVLDFIATARRIVPDPRVASDAQLAEVAQALVELGLRRELFPQAHFPLSEDAPARVYRLYEDLDGHYALYVSAGLPGKAQPPHDHTTWAIIAGIQGHEENVLYQRSPTADPARDSLSPIRTVDVAPGSYIALQPTDVHTIELVGAETGLHLHFYGLGLDRLPGRVVFESRSGGSYRTFAPPALIRHPLISPVALREALRDGEEIALLDVRETGVYTHGHLLLAASAPLWRLELLIDRLVPRRGTRIVLVDGDESLAHEAARKLVRLGYAQVSVLEGGTQAWAAAGHEIFTGTNVPSKAFGEVIEHDKHTPWIDVAGLSQALEQGQNLVVVDSRTPEEFKQFSLPFAHSLPGAELVYRIHELAPDPDTLVVVNCAGRTRSIVGAQTLIDAGIPNRVVSLKDGTMAWLLAGQSLAHGRSAALPEPSPHGLAQAREQAARVAERAGVQRLDAAGLAHLQSHRHERSLYLFDVRTREEYQAGHLEGWRWAPGGQLVQATDEYVGTRRSRIVLADWDGVRALTTAAWLAQLGGHEVYVFTPPAQATTATGAEPVRVLASQPAAARLSPLQLQALQQQGDVQVFDVDRRAEFERRHIPGSRFVVPDRLQEFAGGADDQTPIVITSPDGVLAATVAAELARRLPTRTVRSLAGGTEAWAAAGLPLQSGAEGVLTGDDDHWYSPYAHADLAQRDAGFKAYLDWELGLVAQLEREGDIGIQLIPA